MSLSNQPGPLRWNQKQPDAMRASEQVRRWHGTGMGRPTLLGAVRQFCCSMFFLARNIVHRLTDYVVQAHNEMYEHFQQHCPVRTET